MRTVLATFLLTLPLAQASAQDMVAISWTGRLHALDSTSGALTEIGIGPMGANAMARDESGRVWSTARLLPNFFLTRIDAVTGAVAFSHPSICEPRSSPGHRPSTPAWSGRWPRKHSRPAPRSAMRAP